MKSDGKAQARRPYSTSANPVAGEDHPHRPVYRRSEVHPCHRPGASGSSDQQARLRTGRSSWSPCGGPSEPARLDADLERRRAGRRRDCDAFAGRRERRIKCEPFRTQPAAHLDHDHVVERVSRRDLPPTHQRRHHRIRRGRAHRPLPRIRGVAEPKAIEQLGGLLQEADPAQYTKVLQQVFAELEGNWAAKSAIDIALMDWNGKKLGVPLYRLLGLDAADAPVTTFSIGIDTPEMTRKKVEGSRVLSGAQDQGRARQGRADHRGGAQRNQQAAAGRRERRLQEQGRGAAQD